uniref:Uncharacterized protein n=1 Tax=Aegilops tauschii subsp. strangulata TaxID=200361 RepID=A0A452Z9C5_AEGTS
PTPTDPDHGVASCTRRHRRGTRRCPGSFFSLKSQSGLRQPAGAGLAQRTKAPLLPSSGSDLGLGCTTTSPEERQAISCARGWKIRPPFSETQPSPVPRGALMLQSYLIQKVRISWHPSFQSPLQEEAQRREGRWRWGSSLRPFP